MAHCTPRGIYSFSNMVVVTGGGAGFLLQCEICVEAEVNCTTQKLEIETGFYREARLRIFKKYTLTHNSI